MAPITGIQPCLPGESYPRESTWVWNMGNQGTTDVRYEHWGQRLSPLLTAPAFVVLVLAGVYAIGDAVLAPAPTPDHPSFVDTVLASRAVVGAIRLAVIFAGAFVVVSVVALIARGQWLTKVGPVQVSERVSDVGSQNRRLEGSLEKAEETIDDLEQDLAQSAKRIEWMNRDAKGAG